MTTTYDAVDLFAGAGGWDLAALTLGMLVIGIENNAAACATRLAAGLPTICDDVRAYSPRHFPGARGLIASPPCQPFSSAGKGKGRQALDAVLTLIGRARCKCGECGGIGATTSFTMQFDDDRIGLVLEPLRWALQAIDDGTPYEWLAFEQVPAVLPIWEAMATVLRAEGYSVATGNLQSEQYGVPQTRKRAVLVASLHGKAELPAPTHSKFHPRNPDKLDEAANRWIAMSDVFRAHPQPRGFPTDRSSGWLLAGAGATAHITAQQAPRQLDHPAHTITTKGTAAWLNSTGRPRATVEEAALIQTFPADYPWQGDRAEQYEQIGNAIPPTLAAAVIAAAACLAARFMPRWVSQADALGWGMTHRPYMAVAPGTAAGGTDPQMLGGSGARVVLDAERAARRWVDKPHLDGPETWAQEFRHQGACGCPSPCHIECPRNWGASAPWAAGNRNEGGRLSINEGAVLQTFPPDFPWRGTKREQYQQVGNAIPPLMARAILEQVAA